MTAPLPQVQRYRSFLAAKEARTTTTGPRVAPSDLHPFLHPWQRQVVSWAARTGCAAIWADTGLGKTVMQLEWARVVSPRTLIVAPLAVCHQTVREAVKVGLSPRYLREDDGQPGIVVTNYEISDHFDAAAFGAVVLDEASVIKDVTTKTRDRIIAQFRDMPYRLDCSATPAPNDLAELANHAEFLGRATRREVLSSYFVHDDEGWRVKGHARGPMFRWMASWALAIRRPSDLGYEDGDYQLPPLDIRSDLLAMDVVPEGQLFATDLGGIGGRAKVRRATLNARCEKAIELVNASHELSYPGTKVIAWDGNPSTKSSIAPDTNRTLNTSHPKAEPWVIWCGLNEEQEKLARAFGSRAISVTGSLSPEEKVSRLNAWLGGEYPILLSKPSILGMGINMQHCARMAFVGLSDSYEAYYQAIRRCWRYGQTRPVVVHIILSQLESQIAANVRRKEASAARMTDALITEMRAAGTWRAAA